MTRTRRTGVTLTLLLAAAVISAGLMLVASQRAHALSVAAPVVNVRSYGAKGDGKHNDTAAIVRAMQAAELQQGTVLVPKGVYRVTSLTVPAHTTLRGAGMGKSWLRGSITASRFVDLAALKVGAKGRALHFVNGASHTTFTRVRFVGGGGMSSGNNQGVIRFSGDRAASFITFADCDIAANAGGGDGVAMVDTGWSGGTYHDITFQGSHFGGSPVMDFECIQRSDGVHPLRTGYYNINLTGCVFEPSGAEAISYDGSCKAGHSTISGNTIKGAGWNKAYPWHQGVEFNGAVGMTFTHNTVYRCAGDMINHQQHGVVSNNVFSGNTFDGTVSYIKRKPTLSTDTIYFANVSGATFSDNVVKTDVGGPLVGLSGSAGNSFKGNRFVDTRSRAKAHQCVWATGGSSHNLFTADTFNSSVLYGIAVFKSGSDQNTITDSSFAQPKSDSLSVASGLTVNLASNTYGP